jgi:hypothetical protein
VSEQTQTCLDMDDLTKPIVDAITLHRTEDSQVAGFIIESGFLVAVGDSAGLYMSARDLDLHRVSHPSGTHFDIAIVSFDNI